MNKISKDTTSGQKLKLGELTVRRGARRDIANTGPKLSRRDAPEDGRGPTVADRQFTASIDNIFTVGLLSVDKPGIPDNRPREQRDAEDNMARMRASYQEKVAANHTAWDSFYTAFNNKLEVELEQQLYDPLDLAAITLIDMLMSDVYRLANLTPYELKILYRYFYRTNPIVGPVIDLHTDLPLSKIRLVPPSNTPEIARDYITHFFTTLFGRLDIWTTMRNSVRSWYIYGDDNLAVDDYALDNKNELQALGDFDEDSYKISDEDKKFLTDTENAYRKDPEKVTLEDRRKYLQLKFTFFESSYKGPTRITQIPFWQIEDYFENKETGYEAVSVVIRKQVRRALDSTKPDERETLLTDLGYSKGWATLVEESPNQDKIVLDNDHLTGLPFLIKLERYENLSIIRRVLDECIQYEYARRAALFRIRVFGQCRRLVTAEKLSADQLPSLQAEVQTMLNDPTHAIVANYAINWQEVDAAQNQQLQDLLSGIDELGNRMSDALGMPANFRNNESQYSGANITLEVINTVYNTVKSYMETAWTKQLIKPVAHRKGLITPDSWGQMELVHPMVAFTRMSLRDDSVVEALMNLYLKNSLPVDIIYQIFNLDADDIERGIRRDLFTVKDPLFNELITGAYQNFTQDLANNKDLQTKIFRSLGISTASILNTPSEPGMPGEPPAMPGPGEPGPGEPAGEPIGPEPEVPQ